MERAHFPSNRKNFSAYFLAIILSIPTKDDSSAEKKGGGAVYVPSVLQAPLAHFADRDPRTGFSGWPTPD